MRAVRRVFLVTDAVGRKLRMIAKRVPRLGTRLLARPEDYARRPPIVVTSVPKSGTHLVHQIVEELPGSVDYGTFIATTVSYRRKPRSIGALVKRVRALAPGEIARAHLVHHAEIVDALRAKRAFVVFVYRDPRDVILSEAHYLTDGAPWHTLHREFARRPPDKRIDLAIDGLPGTGDLYPDVATRYTWFEGWLEDADVALRFEDLVGEARDGVIKDLVSRFAERSNLDIDAAEVTDQAIAAIAPQRSHTFREGRTGAWREGFTPAQTERFNTIASATLDRYGYE